MNKLEQLISSLFPLDIEIKKMKDSINEKRNAYIKCETEYVGSDSLQSGEIDFLYDLHTGLLVDEERLRAIESSRAEILNKVKDYLALVKNTPFDAFTEREGTVKVLLNQDGDVEYRKVG